MNCAEIAELIKLVFFHCLVFERNYWLRQQCSFSQGSSGRKDEVRPLVASLKSPVVDEERMRSGHWWESLVFHSVL